MAHENETLGLNRLFLTGADIIIFCCMFVFPIIVMKYSDICVWNSVLLKYLFIHLYSPHPSICQLGTIELMALIFFLINIALAIFLAPEIRERILENQTRYGILDPMFSRVFKRMTLVTIMFMLFGILTPILSDVGERFGYLYFYITAWFCIPYGLRFIIAVKRH